MLAWLYDYYQEFSNKQHECMVLQITSLGALCIVSIQNTKAYFNMSVAIIAIKYYMAMVFLAPVSFTFISSIQHPCTRMVRTPNSMRRFYAGLRRGPTLHTIELTLINTLIASTITLCMHGTPSLLDSELNWII